MESNSSGFRKQNTVFLLILLAVFALQCWKAKQGMGSSDEHFYTTLGYRLFQGDALFYDDWHIAQMISVFLYPLVSLFCFVRGGTEGIILFMRLAYAVFSLLVGTVMYLRFRKRGYSAILAVLVYLLFVPFNIMALSYNTMSVGFLILALLLFDEPHTPVKMVFSGLFYAMAVLNTPYLVLLFILFTLAVTLKKTDISFRQWLFFIAGCGIAAFCFILFVFSRADAAEILSGLPHLIDPSHSTSIPVLLMKNAGRLIQFFQLFVLVFPLEIGAAFYFRKKHAELLPAFLNITWILNSCSILYVCLIRRYQAELGGLSVILIPFAVNGLLYRILVSKDRYLNLCFDISLIHAMLIMISSNVGPRSFSGPLILACAVTILMIPVSKEGKTAAIVSSFIFLAFLLYVRINTVYDGSGSYDTKIEQGPLKGLYDSSENVSKYETTLLDIQAINGLPEQNVLFVTWNSWEYLASDKRIAANSTYIYFWEKEEYMECLAEYRTFHPMKYPAYVYLDESDAPYDLTRADPWFDTMDPIRELSGGFLFLER